MSLQGSGGGGPPLNPPSLLADVGVHIGVQSNKRCAVRRRPSDGPSVPDRNMSLVNAGRAGVVVAETSPTGPVQQTDRNAKKISTERQRRAEEIFYIKQMGGLLSTLTESNGHLSNAIADPSRKITKGSTLQKTIEQLEKLQRNSGHHGGTDLQGSQVSSSKSNLMGFDALGSLALESLDAFILLINSEGAIQYVSENVVQYLGQTQSELESKNILNLVHDADASKFRANLKLVDSHQPMTQRRCQFSCKFLWQSNAADNGSLLLDAGSSGNPLAMQPNDQKRTGYVDMDLISTIIPKNHGGHGSTGSPPTPGGNGLLSIVRRKSSLEPGQISTGISVVEDNIAQSIAGLNSLGNVEKFSTRLNPAGRLINLDLSSLGEPYAQVLKQSLTEGCLFEEILEPVDRAKFQKSFLACLNSEGPTATDYSLRTSPDKPPYRVHVKFLKFTSPGRDNSNTFVNALHSIIVDEPTEIDKEQQPGVYLRMGNIAVTNNQSNLLSNNPAALALKSAGGSSSGSTTPTISLHQNLTTNDGNNNTSFGGMGKNSEKLRNLLIHGSNSNSSSPMSMGASGSIGPVGGNLAQSGNTILKKLLNNSADSAPQGPVDVVIQDSKRHSIFLAGKKNESLIDSAPDAKRSRPDAQLACQNPMLASMLAQTPMPVSCVPPSITNSISQLPQDRLPKNLEQKLLPTPLPSSSAQCSTLTSSAAAVSVASTHPMMALGHPSPSASGNEVELSQIIEDVCNLEEEQKQILSSPARSTPNTVNSLSSSQAQNAIDKSAQPGLMPISPITNSPVLPMMGGGMMPPLGSSESPQSSLQTLLTSPVHSPHPQISVSLAAGHMIKSPGSHTPILVAENSNPAMVLPKPPVTSPHTNASTHDDHSNSPSVLSIASPSSFPMGGSSPPIGPPVHLRNVHLTPQVVSIQQQQQQFGNIQEDNNLLQIILEDFADEKTATPVSPKDPKQAISEIERHLMSTSNSMVPEPYLAPQRPNLQPMHMGPPTGINMAMQTQMPVQQQPQLQQHQMPAVSRMAYQQGAMVSTVPRTQLRMMGVPLAHATIGGIVVQQQQPPQMAVNANFKLQQQQLQRQKLLETQQMARLSAGLQTQHIPHPQQSLSMQQQQQQSQQPHMQYINDPVAPPNVSLQPTSPKWSIPPRMNGPITPGAQHLRAQPQPYQQGPLQ